MSQNGPIVLREDSNIRNMDTLDGLYVNIRGTGTLDRPTHANIKNLNSPDRQSTS